MSAHDAAAVATAAVAAAAVAWLVTTGRTAILWAVPAASDGPCITRRQPGGAAVWARDRRLWGCGAARRPRPGAAVTTCPRASPPRLPVRASQGGGTPRSFGVERRHGSILLWHLVRAPASLAFEWHTQRCQEAAARFICPCVTPLNESQTSHGPSGVWPRQRCTRTGGCVRCASGLRRRPWLSAVNTIT
jgi:hypothetical protein